MARKTGRPSSYTDELADKLLYCISTSSIGLKHICKDIGINPDTVYEWIKSVDGFSDKYAHARQRQAEYMADEILDIADDGSNDFMTIVKKDVEYEKENKEVTNRSRLRVDTRKWLMSKLLPKKFGDKVDVTSGGEKIEQSFVIAGQVIKF